MKELRSLLGMAEEYKTLKPVFEEMQKDKYRFKKAKEKYQAEQQSELKRFYMVRRKLQEAGYEKFPLPVKAWEKELAQVSGEYERKYDQYKALRTELNTLYRIKGDIDTVLRENGLDTQKEKTQRAEAAL